MHHDRCRENWELLRTRRNTNDHYSEPYVSFPCGYLSGCNFSAGEPCDGWLMRSGNARQFGDEFFRVWWISFSTTCSTLVRPAHDLTGNSGWRFSGGPMKRTATGRIRPWRRHQQLKTRERERKESRSIAPSKPPQIIALRSCPVSAQAN